MKKCTVFPDETGYDSFVRTLKETIAEYEFHTGKQPEKIVMTRKLFCEFVSFFDSFQYVTDSQNSDRKIMGIPTDLVDSDKQYFMVGDPIETGGE